MSAGKIFHAEEQLTPGRWYAVGFKPIDGSIDWSGAMLYRYDGEGCWATTPASPSRRRLDPVLQWKVPVGEADAFAEQI